MMMLLKIPKFLHDVFGERISTLELGLITGFGVIASVFLFAGNPEIWQDLALWKIVLLALLALDIFAGCIANFSRSTSQFYATRPRNRLIFIAVHVQPIIMALLLSNHFVFAICVWAYTIITTLVVNALHKNSLQTFVAGFFLSLGLFGFTQLFDVSSFVGIIFMLFFVKVGYSFAVNHYQEKS
jgi:FtsH-binding integral membrane protein